MDVETIRWRAGHWSAALPTHLDGDSTWLMVYGPSRDLPAAALQELLASFPRAVVTGCSTAGEICGTEVDDGTLAVACTRLRAGRVRQRHLDLAQDAGETRTVEGGELTAALVEATRALLAPDLRAVFILSDGVIVNGTQLVAAVSALLPPGVVLSGGLAGDGRAFEQTWVIAERVPRRHCITLTALYGDSLQVHTGFAGGWDPFGPERIVTRARENVLFELDGQPALALYKRYLGDRAAELPGAALLFPLAITSDYMGRKGLVRTVLGIDDDAGSMTFAGDVPEGSRAQFMRASFERLVDGAAQAVVQPQDDLPADAPCLGIAISCVGRRLVLGEQIEDETEAVLDGLPAGARMVGFYSYGEISASGATQCDLHNQTMTVTTLRERAGTGAMAVAAP